MRVLLAYIIFSFALVSCIEVDTRDEQVERSLLIQGLIVSGEPLRDINLLKLDQFGNTNPVSGANLTLTGPFGEVNLIETEAGNYGNPDEIIFASADYRIYGVGPGDQPLNAVASTPPDFEISTSVPSVVTIDVDQPLEQIINLDWTDSGQAEYVLVLSVLEENPIEIPFELGGGNFAVVFANPQPESGTVLLASDLKYYGNHELSIYAVSENYAELFNPLLLVNRDDVPYISGELTGGYGFFEAATKRSIQFIVE